MEEIQKSYHDVAEMIGVKVAPENDPSKAFLQVQKGKSQGSLTMEINLEEYQKERFSVSDFFTMIGFEERANS